MLRQMETGFHVIEGKAKVLWQGRRHGSGKGGGNLPVGGRRQPRECSRESRAAVAKEDVRAIGGGRGCAQVECHKDQHDRADADDDGGDGDGAQRVLRAKPAPIRAAVPALLAARAEDAVVALLAGGVAVVSAAQA